MATRSASAHQGLERAPDDLIKAIRTFGFLFSITLLQWYILINPPELGFSREVASIYMQMGVAFLVIVVVVTSATKIQIKGLKTVHVLWNLVLGFFVAWAFALFLFTQLIPMQFGTVPISAVYGTVITQILFVATTEEMVFRWLIPTYLRNMFKRNLRWLAFLLPQISFALFHVSVYQGDWTALFIAFLFGCVMMLAFEFVPPIGKKEERVKLGLGFTIGCHAAYNLLLIGVIAPGGITMLLGG